MLSSFDPMDSVYGDHNRVRDLLLIDRMLGTHSAMISWGQQVCNAYPGTVITADPFTGVLLRNPGWDRDFRVANWDETADHHARRKREGEWLASVDEVFVATVFDRYQE